MGEREIGNGERDREREKDRYEWEKEEREGWERTREKIERETGCERER